MVALRSSREVLQQLDVGDVIFAEGGDQAVQQ